MLSGAIVGCATGSLGNFVIQLSNPCKKELDRGSLRKSCLAGALGGIVGAKFNNILLKKTKVGPILPRKETVKYLTERGSRTLSAIISGIVAGGTDVILQD